MITRNINLIHRGLDIKAAEMNRVVLVSPSHPALLTPLEPVVRRFILAPVNEALSEQAAVISKTYAVSRKAERRQRIDEACGKSSETAVAERRLILKLLEVRDVLSRCSELRLDIVIEPQIDQVIGEKLADQELSRDIVQLLLALVISLIFRRILCQIDSRVKELQSRAVRKRLLCIRCK